MRPTASVARLPRDWNSARTFVPRRCTFQTPNGERPTASVDFCLTVSTRKMRVDANSPSSRSQTQEKTMTMSDLEVMNSEVGASTPALDAVPSDKELTARDLQERREAAGVEAYRSSIEAACEKISEHY